MKKCVVLCCITFLIAVSSETAWSQNNFLWQHYSLLNPAATGINHQFDVSATGFITGPSTWGTMMNADLRIKKLHGAIGISNHSFNLPNNFSSNSSRFNYSYHLRFNENSTLGIGTGIGVITNYFKYNTYQPNGIRAYTGTFGAHYKWKNLQVGIANTIMTDPGFSRIHLSTLAYADYTWEINSAWKLNFSVIENLDNHQFNLGVRATVYDKFWFGINRENNRFGTQIGYNFTKNFSVGHAFTIENINSNQLQNSRISNSLNLRFTIPSK